MREELTKFHPKVPLMVALRKKGMYERHWEEISKRIKTMFSQMKILHLGKDYIWDLWIT